ncbi:hypothetical protein [Candidatus Liberibacter sp.]|uniref:hypothetical protein n=1 Tax=Candidatus Liberibacter sp. TaxID=34022 RepID=UPI0015F6E725|nr:hypothetical protein [Candidatus Liberibacter sp.]MBA5724579.1 hypothetical protein [Candidatus Liberibacter sp.]
MKTTKTISYFVLLSIAVAAIGGCDSKDIAKYKKKYPDLSDDDIITYKTMQQQNPHIRRNELLKHWESNKKHQDQENTNEEDNPLQEMVKTSPTRGEERDSWRHRFLKDDEDDDLPEEMGNTSSMGKEETTVTKKRVSFSLSKEAEAKAKEKIREEIKAEAAAAAEEEEEEEEVETEEEECSSNFDNDFNNANEGLALKQQKDTGD